MRCGDWWTSREGPRKSQRASQIFRRHFEISHGNRLLNDEFKRRLAPTKGTPRRYFSFKDMSDSPQVDEGHNKAELESEVKSRRGQHRLSIIEILLHE